MSRISPRLEYEKYLNKLGFGEQLAELHHFLLDMADWTKNTDTEKLYTLLAEALPKN